MSHRFLKYSWVLIVTLQLNASMQNVVMNSGFEMDPIHDRPPYWLIGMPDSPVDYLVSGNWSLDTSIKTQGAQSLKLEPKSDDGYAISQVLHVPTFDLKNKTVTLKADIGQQGLSENALVLLVAVNEALDPDPDFGVGISGKTWLLGSGMSASFQSYQSSFIATDAASYLLLICSVSGKSGAAWFDNLSVEFDVSPPGPAPSPVSSPIAQRTFKMGFINENPLSYSEKGWEDVIEKTARSGELINIFFHVRWNQLTGESLDWGHRHQLLQAEMAREAGLEIVLTLDFTHENPNTIGHINPTPDGLSVGRLNNLKVSRAYKYEMFELCRHVRPEVVIVGIETDIFHDNHPDQWQAYVNMFKEIADTLTDQYPGIHVTTYFTLPWMVDTRGNINRAHASLWLQLLPQLQSIAYSTYPEVLGMKGIPLASGYFARPADIAPDLPVMIPEFGVPGGPDAQLSFKDQKDMLERIFVETSNLPLELMCWFSVYDQTYLGVPEPFKTAFHRIGMYELDSTPKPALAVWDAIYHLNTIVAEENPLPENIALSPNFPNPFNSETRINFQITRSGSVQLVVFNGMGQMIKTLYNGWMPSGNHHASWDGKTDALMQAPSGLYFIQLTTGKQEKIQKCILLR